MPQKRPLEDPIAERVMALSDNYQFVKPTTDQRAEWEDLWTRHFGDEGLATRSDAGLMVLYGCFFSRHEAGAQQALSYLDPYFSHPENALSDTGSTLMLLSHYYADALFKVGREDEALTVCRVVLDRSKQYGSRAITAFLADPLGARLGSRPNEEPAPTALCELIADVVAGGTEEPCPVNDGTNGGLIECLLRLYPYEYRANTRESWEECQSQIEVSHAGE